MVNENIVYIMGISDGHEVLTDMGWKLVSSIGYDDYIATLNTLTDSVEFRKPQNLHSYIYTNEMFNLNTSASLCATLNQPLYVLGGGNSAYLNTGSNILNSSPVNFSSNFLSNSPEVISYTFTGTNKVVSMNKWLQFLGLFQRLGKKNNDQLIEISDIVIEKLMSSINGLNRELQNDLQLKVVSYISSPIPVAIIWCPIFVYNDLSAIPPQWCYRLGNVQLNEYLGNYPLKHQNKEYIDALQALYLLNGKQYNIVYLNSHYKLEPQQTISSEYGYVSLYNGIVYEISVPNLVYMIRRDNKPLLV